MKIVDKTPIFKNGQLSLIDRIKALLQFGPGWIKEIEAQGSVISVMDRVLDKNFTALRNVVLPGLEAEIPIILVGPTGLYVICVTALTGMFRAKADQWGSISGNTFRPEKPNLLIRTERLMRVVQVYLQNHGYTTLSSVEGVLLCSDPTIHIDSQRPIVRVVMRDALERFAVSISQGRAILSPESIFDIINRILNPPTAGVKAANPAADAAGTPADQPGEDPFSSPNAFLETQPFSSPGDLETPPPRFVQRSPAAAPVARLRPGKKGMNGKQWAVLFGMFIIWFLIVVVFIFLALNPDLIP